MCMTWERVQSPPSWVCFLAQTNLTGRKNKKQNKAACTSSNEVFLQLHALKSSQREREREREFVLVGRRYKDRGVKQRETKHNRKMC
jgi:hypothetical protein